MLNFFKKKEEFTSPVTGKMIPLSEVNDAVFSQKMMGDGFAVVPSGSSVCTPLSGEVSVCFPTHHAIGIKTKSGIEFLIHIGIDTVELKGQGFESKVVQGQEVHQGDKLVEVDWDFIHSNGYDSTVMVVFPNNNIEISETTKTIEAGQPVGIKIK